MTVEATRSGIDLTYVDAGARPQDDLFGHVNGRWLADYEIPADRATDGAFRSLSTAPRTGARPDHRSRPRRAAPTPGTDEQRIGDLYASFMDEDTVERGRCAAAARRVGGDRRRRRPRRAGGGRSAALQRTGVGGGVGVYVDTDSKNSTRYLVHLSASPGSDCPTSPTTATSSTPRSWPPTRHIARMFALVYGGARRDMAEHGRTDRRAGDQAGRRALGRGQAPRRRPDLQPAHVRRPARRGPRLRLGRLGDRARHHTRVASPNLLCANRTT